MTAISAVGSIANAAAANALPTISSFVSNTVGDGLILVTRTKFTSATRFVTSVSGGGVGTGLQAWTELGRFTTATANNVIQYWAATVVSPTTSNITITQNSTGTNNTIFCQEFTAGLGARALWVADGSVGGSFNGTNSTTLNLPTLVPSGSDRAYIGHALGGSNLNAGSQTAGYTMTIATGDAQTAMLYDPQVSGSQSPTCTQAPTNIAIASGVLLYATDPRSADFMPFFGHHHEPHEELTARRYRRRGGLYVPRRELTVARAA